MFLKTVTAIGLCATPLCAQDWQLSPASLSTASAEASWTDGLGSGLDSFSSLSFGPVEVRSSGALCIDIPGGRSNCEVNVQGDELMLIDREAQGRMRVRFRFSIRP
jgi:hypothetical protein